MEQKLFFHFIGNVSLKNIYFHNIANIHEIYINIPLSKRNELKYCINLWNKDLYNHRNKFFLKKNLQSSDIGSKQNQMIMKL
jgi:hypothetical protein